MRDLFIRVFVIAVLAGAFACRASAVTALEATSPPPNEHSILTLQGKGSQIYACHQIGSRWEWQFVAPEAQLFDAAGREEGTHGNGPIWRYEDASSVTGQLVSAFPSSDPQSIPWLLLKAANHEGTGRMSSVEFIRRSDTHGGTPPPTGCDSQHASATSRSPYTAIYTFYSATP